MSQLQVTKITTVDNTTPLILATGNAGGGQIIVQSSNTDVFFNGNINFSNYVTGDGSGLFLPTSNVANAAFNTANAAYASANNVAPQVTPAFNTANSAFNTANAAFASANNVAPQVTPSYNTANAAFNTANAAYTAANNVGPQIAPTYNTANSAFAQANIASNTATGAYNAANAAYNNANAAFNAANGKFSSSGGTISGAVEITADLTVHGNTRFIDQQTLSVGDPLIYLAANNYTSDVVDIGFVANYVNSTSANVHTGLYRSSGTKEYYLFYGYDKEPYNNYIDPTGNNIQQAVLNSTLRTSNVILGGANAINWIRSAYAQANAGGANVGQTAPTGVSSGKLWWNSDLGKLYVYYTDPANTSSWVETSPSASAIESAIITGYINPVYNTTNAAYTTANVVYNQSNVVFGTVNASFAKANTALQNTTGTFSGTLTLAAGGLNLDNSYFISNKDETGTSRQVLGTASDGTVYFYGYHATTMLSGVNGITYVYPSGGSGTLSNALCVTSSGIGLGTYTPASSFDLSVKTDAMVLPKGTTAQRPSSAANGMIRYNTTIPAAEIYNGSTTGWGTIRQDWLGVPETVTNLAYHRWGFPNVSGSFMINSGKSGDPLMLGGGYSLNSTTYKYGNAALDLNGSSGYGIMRLPIVASGQAVLGMISFWIYWRGHNGSGRSYLFESRSGNYGPDPGGGYWIIDSNNTMVVYCGGSEKTNSWTPTTNTWEHYALYTDGSSTYIYRNGSLSLTLSGYYRFSDRNILGTFYGAVGGSGNYFTNAIFDNLLVSFHPSITPSVVYNEAFSY